MTTRTPSSGGFPPGARCPRKQILIGLVLGVLLALVLPVAIAVGLLGDPARRRVAAPVLVLDACRGLDSPIISIDKISIRSHSELLHSLAPLAADRGVVQLSSLDLH